MAEARPMQVNQQLMRPTACQESSDGDYLALLKCQTIYSQSNQYQVKGLVGVGKFGPVISCSRIGKNEMMAIKVLKIDTKRLERSIRIQEEEVATLTFLKRRDQQKANIVRFYESFRFDINTCLVFELLDINLGEFVKQNEDKRIALMHIRPIMHQILNALLKLRGLHIIHSDLNPQNIMLVDSLRQPFRVKLIDFGSAIRDTKASPDFYLQSRFYRSPEIVLGLSFNQAIDIWSLGCIVAELFLGWPLYPGPSSYHHISFICHTQGLPPKAMLKNGIRTTKYFIQELMPPNGWRIKNPGEAQYRLDAKTTPRNYLCTSLDQIKNVNPIPINVEALQWKIEMIDRNEFVVFLKRMLDLDPNRRITPWQALDQPFMTLRHLDEHKMFSYVLESFEIKRSFCYINSA